MKIKMNSVAFSTIIPVLGLCACQVTVPATDTVKPRLGIAIEDSGLKAVASTDPGASLTQGCPAGTSTTLQDVYAHHRSTYQGELSINQNDIDTAYFYSASAKPFKLSVISADDGGTSAIRATFNDRTLDQLTNPNGSSGLTNISPASATISPTYLPSTQDSLTVRLDIPASDARSLSTLSFQINDFIDRPVLSAFSSDFHGNKAAIVAHFFPASVCQ